MPLWRGLVVEVLLQRTRAEQVVPVFLNGLARYRTAEAFGQAAGEEIEELVRPLGLHWRGPLLLRLAREIGRLKGQLPRTAPALERLPGVGSYAAAAALSLHGGSRAAIVDANVVRVLARLLGQRYDAETRRKRWLVTLSERLTPDVEFRDFNYALLDLGMSVCTVRAPRCESCPILEFCVYARIGAGKDPAVA